MEDPAAILLVRLSAIGDAIHALPVLNALRDRFPRARLGWVVEGRTATLLEGHPSLDQLFNVRRGWLKRPSEVWALRKQLHAARFDTAVDVQGLTKSAIVAWLSGARRRIGFGDAKGRELSQWFYTDRVATDAPHIIDANLQLLRALDIRPPYWTAGDPFRLPEKPQDAAAAERIRSAAGAFAIVNPGAGWVSKLWPPERFGAVARYLNQKHGLPVLVVWAGDDEHQRAEQIAAVAGDGTKVAPPTSLGELAALCRRAAIFIASDTGPLHLAAAVGTRCVGLFGPMPAERNGPYGDGHETVQKCRFEGTSRERRNAPASVMEAIAVEDVCAACDRVLAGQSESRQQAIS